MTSRVVMDISLLFIWVVRVTGNVNTIATAFPYIPSTVWKKFQNLIFTEVGR